MNNLKTFLLNAVVSVGFFAGSAQAKISKFGVEQSSEERLVEQIMVTSLKKPRICDANGQWRGVAHAEREQALKEVEKILAKDQVNLNTIVDSESILNWAVIYNCPEVVKLLLAHRPVSPNSTEVQLVSPLTRAAVEGSFESIYVLLKDPRIVVGYTEYSDLLTLYYNTVYKYNLPFSYCVRPLYPESDLNQAKAMKVLELANQRVDNLDRARAAVQVRLKAYREQAARFVAQF